MKKRIYFMQVRQANNVNRYKLEFQTIFYFKSCIYHAIYAKF